MLHLKSFHMTSCISLPGFTSLGNVWQCVGKVHDLQTANQRKNILCVQSSYMKIIQVRGPETYISINS